MLFTNNVLDTAFLFFPGEEGGWGVRSLVIRSVMLSMILHFLWRKISACFFFFAFDGASSGAPSLAEAPSFAVLLLVTHSCWRISTGRRWQCVSLSILRYHWTHVCDRPPGTMDIWIQLTTSAGSESPKAAGKIHCIFTFTGPLGVAYPQHQSGVDSFDHSQRINLRVSIACCYAPGAYGVRLRFISMQYVLLRCEKTGRYRTIFCVAVFRQT